jgi:rhodanese-related sulfurtransferase
MKPLIVGYLSLLLMMTTAYMGQSQIITEVSSLEFYEHLMHMLGEETTVLIDGRSKEMFEKEHIAGAIYIDAFQDGFLPELSSYAGKSCIVVYCTTNRRTKVLIDSLKTFYTGHVVCICDGITGWKQHNLPLVQ